MSRMLNEIARNLDIKLHGALELGTCFCGVSKDLSGWCDIWHAAQGCTE